MKLVYPAIFTEEDGIYIVEFPDLEGCQTFGETLEETMENAEEALTGYLLTLLESEQIPARLSNIKEIDPVDGFVTLVSANVSQYRETKAVKKTLTIPAWLNNLVVDQGVNFSETLKEGLIKKVGMSKLNSKWNLVFKAVSWINDKIKLILEVFPCMLKVILTTIELVFS